MARTIILAALAVTMAFVSVETENSLEINVFTAGHVSRLINIPDVRIERWQVPRFYIQNEGLWLQKCRVTTNITNREDLTVDEDSVEMKEIRQIAKEINEISKEFETAYNSGTYRFTVSDRNRLEKLAARLKTIDEGLPYERRDGHEGAEINAMCHDVHTILTQMFASRTKQPQSPPEGEKK